MESTNYNSDLNIRHTSLFRIGKIPTFSNHTMCLSISEHKITTTSPPHNAFTRLVKYKSPLLSLSSASIITISTTKNIYLIDASRFSLASFRYRLRHRCAGHPCMKMVALELMFTFFSVYNRTIVVVLLLRNKGITQLQLYKISLYRMLIKNS